jgi:ABC-type lipoprotein export system ATPase subunit
MSLIEIKKLSKTYNGGEDCVRALVDVYLNIEKGEFVSVMGPSGSGKSTLLTILGGLNHPTEGELVVDEIPIYKLSLEKLADFRREYLGFIFQSFQLIPYLTVIEKSCPSFGAKVEQEQVKDGRGDSGADEEEEVSDQASVGAGTAAIGGSGHASILLPMSLRNLVQRPARRSGSFQKPP